VPVITRRVKVLDALREPRREAFTIPHRERFRQDCERP